MNPVTGAWLVEVAIITYRDFKKGSASNVGGLPLPADYLATFVVFGILGLFSGEAAKPAQVAAWGYVIATFLNLFPNNVVPKSSGVIPAPPTGTQEGPGPSTSVSFLTYPKANAQ